MSDTPHAVEITSLEDHRSTNPCEYVIGKPKMSLFELLWIFYNLKKLLETCYEKLEEGRPEDNPQKDDLQSETPNNGEGIQSDGE